MEKQEFWNPKPENRIIGEPVVLNLKPEKYRANMDKSLILKNKFETQLFWFKLYFSKDDHRAVVSGKTFEIKAFRQGEYNGFLKGARSNKYEGKIVPWWKLYGNYINAECLHDPTAITDLNILKIK